MFASFFFASHEIKELQEKNELTCLKFVKRVTFGFFAGTLCFYGIAVLFGAPLLNSFERTLLWSVILSLLVAVPSSCVIGFEKNEWMRLFLRWQPHNVMECFVLCSSFGALLGTWIGAFPVPLDWDVWWQEWPISCVFGAVLGYLLGVIATFLWIFFRPPPFHCTKDIHTE
jgi:phosphatidylinositol glycan class F